MNTYDKVRLASLTLASLAETGYIVHSGVLGMKWGVRKAGRASHAASVMTDSELRSAITRMSLERQYAKLAAENPSAGDKAAKWIAGIIAVSATKVATKYATEKFKKMLPQT